jgi:hypothetical protein
LSFLEEDIEMKSILLLAEILAVLFSQPLLASSLMLPGEVSCQRPVKKVTEMAVGTQNSLSQKFTAGAYCGSVQARDIPGLQISYIRYPSLGSPE